jgi:hypothetical protein
MKHANRPAYKKTGIPAFIAAIFFSFSAFAADANPVEQQIMKKLEEMQAEITTLKSQLKNYQEKENVSEQKSDVLKAQSDTKTTSADLDEIFKPNTPQTASQKIASTKSLNEDLNPGEFGMTYRSNQASSDMLRFGAYGEIKFGRQETPEGWKNGFDAGRVVLLGTYPIAENILFNTELEFEHGGIAKDEDDKLGGSVDVEQVFVDFKVNDYFNWRAPGVDIVPVGYVGLFHEPTQFYSVDRPELYNGLIPSTWFEGATSAYGKVVDNLTYQFQINTGLEDAGTLGDEPDSSVPAGGYDPGISGTEALGLSRASISDRKQLGNNLGYALRFAYTPPVVPGLAGSTSIYYTSNTSARGAYGTNADDSTRPLGKSDLTMVDTELRYRIPKTGVEMRGEYVQAFFGSPENLRANNDQDETNNVGDSMYGYSFEGAYHYNLTSSSRAPWELVPFYRYTMQNFQTGGFKGTDDNQPTGEGKQQFHTFGVALFPTPKLVLKFDYQMALDDAPDSPKNDSFLGGVGFFF